MSRVWFQCVVALACVAAVSSRGAAQQATVDASLAAPTIAGATAGVRVSASRQAAALVGTTGGPAATERRNGRALAQSQVLMIVGGAAFVSGILIGGPAGTILALGGAGIGGYGLYLYLQR